MCACVCAASSCCSHNECQQGLHLATGCWRGCCRGSVLQAGSQHVVSIRQQDCQQDQDPSVCLGWQGRALPRQGCYQLLPAQSVWQNGECVSCYCLVDVCMLGWHAKVQQSLPLFVFGLTET